MKFSVTFYDLIGYLVPGFLFNVVLSLLATFFLGSDILIQNLNKLAWPWHLILAYISGHLVQAISTLIFKINYEAWWGKNRWAGEFKDRINLRLTRWISGESTSQQKIDGISFHLAESLVKNKGHLEKADVFRALQGFFRAMTSVFGLLSITCALFFFKESPLLIHIEGKVAKISHYTMGTVSLISFACSILTYIRFRQFASYRFRTILLGFYVSNDVLGEELRIKEIDTHVD